MTTLLLAAALSGLILGRFFKVYILAPVSLVAIILACSGPHLIVLSSSAAIVQLILLLGSLQFGYVAGVASNQFSISHSFRRRLLGPHSVSSRTLHVR